MLLALCAHTQQELNFYTVEPTVETNQGEVNLQARKVTEAIGSTFDYVKNAIDVPLGKICVTVTGKLSTFSFVEEQCYLQISIG